MSPSTSALTENATASNVLLSADVKDRNHECQDIIIAQTRAIELNPRDPLAFYTRGVAYYRLGDHRSAIVDYTQAIELNPLLEIVYYRRGFSYYSIKDYSNAIVDYNRSIKIKPDFALAYANRGYAYRDLYGEQEALIDWRFAAKLFKEEGNITKYQSTMKLIDRIYDDASCASGML